jgi:hypothetical protein
LLGIYKYAYYAPWIQDDWRVSKRLSLNLGFRWDFNTPPTERFNRMNWGFDANVGGSVNQLINQQQFPVTPSKAA